MINKLIEVQAKLKAPKNQTNKFGGYNYRSCEDIVEGVKPLLKEQGLVLTITDTIVQVGERYYIKATATVTDGDNNISVEGWAREEENKKGMDSMQLSGATSSYARKYALNGLFAIDDTKDSDATNDHGKGQQSTNKPLSEGQVKRLFAIGNNKGVSATDIKKAVLKEFKKDKIESLTKSEYDAIVRRLEAKDDAK